MCFVVCILTCVEGAGACRSERERPGRGLLGLRFCEGVRLPALWGLSPWLMVCTLPCGPGADACLCPQCQIIYPRQQLLTLRELEMIGFIENNVSKLSLLLSEISRCELMSCL